jgi:hypothetical protein
MSPVDTVSTIQNLLSTLPEPLQVEALHYVEYLSQRSQLPESNVNQPVTPKRKRNGFGILKGKISMSEDFDAPLEAFEGYR